MSLFETLEKARREVDRNPHGDLSLRTRRALQSALDTLSDDVSVTYLRRIWLTRRCVERVTWVWTQAFPNDPLLSRILALSDPTIIGFVDPGMALNGSDWPQSNVAEGGQLSGVKPALLVGQAAAILVTSMLQASSPNVSPYSRLPGDLWPSDQDPVTLCASAAAGGPDGASDNPELRRGFWLWYCNEAVPETYQLRRY